jgi:predicted Zn-dependent peptidase
MVAQYVWRTPLCRSFTNESIDASTRGDFVSFHRANFVPNNAVFIAVGDVQFEDVVARLESLFSAWDRAPT